MVVPVEEEHSRVVKSWVKNGEEGILGLGWVVPVPMKYPCQSLEGKKPWLFSEDITQ